MFLVDQGFFFACLVYRWNNMLMVGFNGERLFPHFSRGSYFENSALLTPNLRFYFVRKVFSGCHPTDSRLPRRWKPNVWKNKWVVASPTYTSRRCAIKRATAEGKGGKPFTEKETLVHVVTAWQSWKPPTWQPIAPSEPSPSRNVQSFFSEQ